MSRKEEIIATMEQFEKLHMKYLPKVNRGFVIDLFLRLRENPNVKPVYTIETWVEEGGDPEAIRNEVMRMTGMVPQIFDRSTHLVANHRIDYELLKQINDHPKVLEVTGTYMGSQASIGASHESSAEIRRGQR
ncbi:MAG: hypothetical protein ACREBU_09725 [Nitrososphaera sp.]